MSITTEQAMTVLIDLVDNINEDVDLDSVSQHFRNILGDAEVLTAEYHDKDSDALVIEPSNKLVEGDYELDKSVWLTAENISVRVYKTDEGVVCDMWPLNQEDGEPLATTYAFYADGENNG